MLTRASILKESIMFSLGRVTVHIGRRFYKLGLTPTMVNEIATKAIADMRERGRWPELDKEIGSGPDSGPR